MKIAIINARIILPHSITDYSSLIYENGKITAIGGGIPSGIKVIDAKGCYLSPGFIDMHTHGAGGADYMDGSVNAYLTAAKMQAEHGTTTVYPTTLTSSNDVLFETFETYRKAHSENKEGAFFGGLHLEGPYFASEYAGAQDPRYLRNPDPKDYLQILEKGEGLLTRWSFAPELPGAHVFALELKKRGILGSIGHTNATFEQCDESFKNGTTHMTHFFSCMSTLVKRNARRYAGAVEYGYYQDGMTVEIIADGIHVSESLLKLIVKIKGVDKVALVTDSMRAAGMPEGPSILGSIYAGQPVVVEEGVAKLPDHMHLAASVATTDRLVRTMINIAGCSLHDSVRMISENPAKIMRIYNTTGSIEVGKDADLVIFDDDIRIKRTIVKGRTIFVC